MVQSLRSAMLEMLDGWQGDPGASWRAALGEVSLNFAEIDPALELEPWEPIFPVRKGRQFPGMPKNAHCLRAFDRTAPDTTRCVILGQDPYPEPGFSTGRAFEAGNLASWTELDKMFSKSVRVYLQLIIAARTGRSEFARSFEDWPAARRAIESGEIVLQGPDDLADHLEDQGVLLLNAALTLSRFSVTPGPHQVYGHLPLWRPLICRTINALMARNAPVVFIGFGDAALDIFAQCGLVEGRQGNHALVSRAHPAFAEEVLSRPNPFTECNAHLTGMGAKPIEW